MIAVKQDTLFPLFNTVEPANASYQSLRNALKKFVDSMDTKNICTLIFLIKIPWLSLRICKKGCHSRFW